jgi:glycosyltransferase involved in cell wall biosynthesis
MPIYGIDILLRAAAMLVKEHPEMKLRVKIAGDGPQEAELKALAGELGISGITEFAGRISQEECADLYANLGDRENMKKYLHAYDDHSPAWRMLERIRTVAPGPFNAIKNAVRRIRK